MAGIAMARQKFTQTVSRERLKHAFSGGVLVFFFLDWWAPAALAGGIVAGILAHGDRRESMITGGLAGLLSQLLVVASGVVIRLLNQCWTYPEGCLYPFTGGNLLSYLLTFLVLPGAIIGLAAGGGLIGGRLIRALAETTPVRSESAG